MSSLAEVTLLLLLLLCPKLSDFVRATNSFEEKGVTYQGLNTFADLINKKIEKNERCKKKLNLDIEVNPDHKHYLDVSFKVTESRFNDCYDFYNISLRKFRTREETAILVSYDKKFGASYRFENVECGSYNLTIQCCLSKGSCLPNYIGLTELVNKTGVECLGLKASNKLHYQQQQSVIVIITIVSILLILIVGAVSFCFYWSAERDCNLRDFIIKKKNETVISLEEGDAVRTKNKKPPRKHEIVILHSYNQPNNERVRLLIDFLQKTDCYESVTTIEYSLSKILFEVKKWLDKMLETSKVDGGVRKIILIASESSAEAGDHEIENLLFSKFLDKINDDSEKCLKGYDHLFVVQFEKQLESHPEEFRNVVRRVRFILSEELLKDHLVNLCLNLCSESEQNSSHIEINLRELFSRHPIRSLEHPLLDV